VRSAAESVTTSRLTADLAFLAADRFGGRITPSAGLDSATAYVMSRVQRLGLRPGGDSGSFLQSFPLSVYEVDTSKSFVEVGGRRFSSPRDFAATFLPPRPGTTTGTVAFVGHGISVPSRGIDPYSGIDFKDRILLLWGPATPPNTSPDEWARPGFAIRDNWWNAPAAIWIPRFDRLTEWWQRQSQLTQSWTLPSTFPEPIGGRPWIMGGPTLVEALLEGERMNAAQVYGRSVAGDPPASFELSSSKRVTISIATNKRTAHAANVIAVIEGADPRLKNEYVTLQAHLDGTVDRYVVADDHGNAADDNASGAIALLGIADAFAAAPRPKRSVVLLWDSGEEKGLLGTNYFLERGTIAAPSIVAHFNLDMVGRSRSTRDTSRVGVGGESDVYVTGPRSMSSQLDAMVEGVNADYLRLRFDRTLDTWDSDWLYPRADHIPFLKRGIPVAFFFTGMHGDYHMSSDNAAAIDVRKVQRIAQTVFATAWMVANSSRRPAVDRPIPERVRR
jgi:hypothetical protein